MFKKSKQFQNNFLLEACRRQLTIAAERHNSGIPRLPGTVLGCYMPTPNLTGCTLGSICCASCCGYPMLLQPHLCPLTIVRWETVPTKNAADTGMPDRTAMHMPYAGRSTDRPRRARPIACAGSRLVPLGCSFWCRALRTKQGKGS